MSKYYKVFDFYNMKSNNNLHIIDHFNTILQTTDYTCATCCVMMILGYYGIKIPDEINLAKMCNTREKLGTRLIDLISALKRIVGFKIISSYDLKDENGISFKTYEDFKKFAIESIDKKIPIIVENCDYGGHYRVLIGIDEVNKQNSDEDILIFADPCDFNDGEKDGYTYVPADRFFYMWFDDHLMEFSASKQAFIQILPE